MFEESGFLFPYLQLQSFPISPLLKPTTARTFTLSECDAGGEGDLFKAPVSIIEEPVLGYDPMTAAISMISCSGDAISAQMAKAADIEFFQSDHLLSEVFYGCKKDLMEKSALDESFSKVLDIRMPATEKEEDLTAERKGFITGSPMQKSISSGALSSMNWIKSGAIKPSFLDFQMMDPIGMRRAFSEGDIQTLHSPFEKTLKTSNCTSEDRKLRLSRYRIKKAKRNFSRKIKYACRKALADNQPRVRGRFARTEEASVPNALKYDGCKCSTESQVKHASLSAFYHIQEPATTVSLQT